ncbi:DedA family protein [Ectothiorhodospiraceae bacterium BW-2]|nr:DedA family protein [Ectothiorhodospiraceae bacterium BW-2]
MAIFSRLYERVMRWSVHPKAPHLLAGMSFAESSFFPIPPDVMLAPMVLAQPERAWRFAFITTIASLLGGVLGYFIGLWAFDLVEPLLQRLGYMDKIDSAGAWFDAWGVWVVFLAGFSPIPYKMFTITAGLFQMALLPFMIASLIGRGARFYLVAGLIWWGGEAMERALRRHVDTIGWGVVALVGVGLLLYQIG